MSAPVQITPYAILAAILFNLDKTEQAKVKADDSGEDVTIDAPVVSVECEGDALVCAIPTDKVAHFAETVYDCKIMSKSGHMLISFERRKDGGGIALVAANGKPIAPQNSAAINKLLERMSGGN